jgi:hypothetical protein
VSLVSFVGTLLAAMALASGAVAKTSPLAFSAPTVIGTVDSTAPNFDVGIGDKGEAVVLWTHYYSTGGPVVEAASRPAAGAWSTPDALSPNNGFAMQSDVAVDDKGDAVAVWARYGGSQAVEAASRPAGGPWSTPTVLSASGGSPHVAVGDTGDAVAVWTRGTDSGVVVEAASRPPRGSWSTPTALSASDTYSSNPQVAVGKTGDAVAVWTRGTDSRVVVEAASRPPRGSWSTPTALSASDTYSSNPQVAVGKTGDAVAVWTRGTDSRVVVEAASRPPRGSWSTPTALSARNTYSFNPQVALSDHGEAIAAWNRFSGGPPYDTGTVVETASRPAGGPWSPPATLGDTNGWSLQVTVDHKGEAIAVWTRYTGSTPDISGTLVEAASRPARGTWSTPTQLSHTNGWSSSPNVAVSDKGHAVVVWQRPTGSGVVVEATSRLAGAAWSTPTTLTDAGFSPKVAVGNKGKAVIVWARYSASWPYDTDTALEAAATT